MWLLDCAVCMYTEQPKDSSMYELLSLQENAHNSRNWYKIIVHTLAVILFGPGGLFMSKMPMFQRAGMTERGLSLPPAFQYLILMI